MKPNEDKPTMRVADPELQAMAKLDTILSELPEASVDRVVAWIISRFAQARPLPEETPDI